MTETAAAPSTPSEEEATAPVEEPVVKINRFSDFVHVGEGAEECEHRLDGKCANEDHFHAWVCLPNKFQVSEIREKAQAARARVIRQAKDPATDRYEILENQLAEARAGGHSIMVDELLSREMYKYQHQAMRELADEEDSPWATIEDDQKRWRELEAMDEEDRDADEYGELTRHLEAWNDAVDAKYDELIAPQRSSLEDRDEDELVELLRDIAIREQADQIFMRTFAKYQYLLCTLLPRGEGKRPKERVYSDVNQLASEAPEVVAALEATFNDLESELAGREALRAEGN